MDGFIFKSGKSLHVKELDVSMYSLKGSHHVHFNSYPNTLWETWFRSNGRISGSGPVCSGGIELKYCNFFQMDRVVQKVSPIICTPLTIKP